MRYVHIGEESQIEAVAAIADTLATGTPVAQQDLKKAANGR